MASGPQAFAARLSKFLSEHRLASFLVTAAALVLMAEAVRRVLPNGGQVSVLTGVLLAPMAYAPIATVYTLRRGPQPFRLVMAWSVGVTPALFGIAAALNGSPAIVMWGGVLLAIALVGWIVRTGKAV
ncbi:MAG TPA: hypothetical protein VE754_04175 [Actinomycetota bacterium]|jgi:hypothetical protein|nr:hypothetical protein [Actinomycetota bacterium]